MRIVRFLMEHKLAVLMVTCLLIVQAFCDLSLPKYTSDIVDVGIQQAGVEDVATNQLSAQTYDFIAMVLPGEDEALFCDSYDKCADGTYQLNDFGKGNRGQLNDLMTMPMVAVHLMFHDDLKTGQSAALPFTLDELLASYQAGVITKDDIQAQMAEMSKGAGEVDLAMMRQQALVAAKAEYQELGCDMTQIQMDYLWFVGAIMLGLAALSMLVNVIIGLIASITGAKIGRDLRGRLFSRVVSFSDAEVNKFSAASLITRGTNDIQLIQMICILFQRIVLYAPILAIGGIIMVSQTNLSMAWVIILGIVAVLVVVGLLMAITMPKFKIMQKLIDKVNLVSREIITGLPVIRAFGMEDHERDRFNDASRTLMKTQLFTSRVMALMMPALMMIMNCLGVLIVWVGGHYINDGTIQTGDLIAFITYSMIVVTSFLMIGMIAVFLPRANVAAERINEVIVTCSSIVDAENVMASSPEEMAKLKAQGTRIEFDDVCFRYDEESNNVLDHVSFVAEPGKTTAIVGSTGSGKTTIIKLIERFYDVNEGAVLVDGVDVRQMTQSDLRSRFGYVPQKAFLFAGTIESNVAYGAEDQSDERIQRSLDIAQASEFVNEKEEGLQTPIAQGGTNVSGGQRQRLAIARALSVDAGAYLFDDSFSALDYKTDSKLRQEIASKLAGRTVIIVAQRIATIMNADHIVVLEDGKIVGQGTHGQLLDSCSAYSEIAHSQLSEEELRKGVTQNG